MGSGAVWGSIIGIGALIGGCAAGCSCTDNWEISNGQRTGMVNKISRRGYWFDSWEGQMALEGISSGGDSIGANVWNFSLDRYKKYGDNPDALAERLRGYMDSGTKVKITYVEVAKHWPWRSDTDYFITDVMPVAIPGTGNEKVSPLEKEAAAQTVNQSGNEVTIDGRIYILRHDKNGKLRVSELRDVDTK